MTAPSLHPVRDPAGAEPSHGFRRRRPTVRRLTALEPPYDDDLTGAGLHLVGQPELPFDEPAPRRFEHDIDFFDPQPTPRRDLPEPEPWATRFVRAVLETVAGSRPPGQLHDWTTADVYAGVLRAAKDRRWRTGTGMVPTVRSVHATEPADGVAEICAVVQRGGRAVALAARLEGFDGRWRCVALELG